MREPLPTRRRSTTVKADIAGTNVYYTFSRYADGRIAEVFVDVQRAGTALRGAMTALAIVISTGLQYGVPIGVITEGIRGIEFEPRDTTYTSIIDYLARALAKEAE